MQSKDRCERTVEGGAPRTGSRDATRNKPSFARLPMLHSPRRGADRGSDHFCSSAFTTRECARPDVIFFAIAPAPDRIFTYTRIHRAPDCAITWQERNIQNRDVNYCNQIVGSGKTRNAAPARSISAVAFTRRETLLSGLRQSHYGAANPSRWRNPRQPSATPQLSNGTVQLHSDGLGAAHG